MGNMLGGMMGGKSCGRKAGESCMSKQQCSMSRGKWKNKGCAGGYDCGCCKIKGYSYLQVNETEVAVTNHMSNTGTLPVQISVQWHTPVLQKYQCVSVAPQYAKTGAQSLFIAMGWDTESGITNLDLDLSLVPVNKMKQVINHKTVFYGQKAPQALQCGGNQYAMQAFNDDQSGDQPGDDELVKVNLGCLGQMHHDVEAVVVVVSVYAPQQLTWNQIDSAYLRIVSGGMERASGGNFFIQNAEAVRSFVRLSGNDLKEDPGLAMNSIAVGMFFRQPSPNSMVPNWAFGTLMKGLPGRNAQQVAQPLQSLLSDLVYPANTHWDQTVEQQALHQQGAFGNAGIHGKASVSGLIGNGQLPCIASKTDQARIQMGHMTPTDLQRLQNNPNPNIPQDVKNFAGMMQQNPQVANKIQGMAQGVEQMEKANSEQQRKQIANQIGQTQPRPPTQQESSQAAQDLDSLFDAV